MKPKFIIAMIAVLFIFGSSVVQAEKKINQHCQYQGKKLYGKIKIVENSPDLKIQIVSSFPDLKVKWVQSFPDKCGLWQVVESFPELKIQFVESFPDLKIQFVESFPGLP